MSRNDWIQLLYIVAFSMFIIGLHMLRGPRSIRSPVMKNTKATM